MNKLVNIINNMSKEDLLKIRNDIEEGNLIKLINNRLAENTDQSICPVCHKEIKSSKFEFTFGPADMKMKACFDEIDCMQHFIERLRKKSSSSVS